MTPGRFIGAMFLSVSFGVLSGVYATTPDCTNKHLSCGTWGPGDITGTCCSAMGFVLRLGQETDEDATTIPGEGDCGTGSWETNGQCEPIVCGYCCGGSFGDRSCDP